MLTQNIGYPNYEQWVKERCIPEIGSDWEKKHSSLFWKRSYSECHISTPKELPRTREFKDMRVDPSVKRRDVGHFLLRQVEEEEIGGLIE